MEVFDIK